MDFGELAAIGAEHLRQRREHGRADEVYAEVADHFFASLPPRSAAWFTIE